MKTKICALVIGLAIFATNASAATISLFYTGVVTSSRLDRLPDFDLVGHPFSLSYSLNTDLASSGNYINTGTFSSLSGTFPSVGSAIFISSGIEVRIIPQDLAGCNCGIISTNSSQIDTQSAQLAAFQSVSYSILGAFFFQNDSVQTQLVSNPAIPGDITAAFALEGVGIGTGNFRESGAPPSLHLISLFGSTQCQPTARWSRFPPLCRFSPLVSESWGCLAGAGSAKLRLQTSSPILFRLRQYLGTDARADCVQRRLKHHHGVPSRPSGHCGPSCERWD